MYKVKSDTNKVIPIIQSVNDECKYDEYLFINKEKFKHNNVLRDIDEPYLRQFADKIINNYIIKFNFISSHMALPDSKHYTSVEQCSQNKFLCNKEDYKLTNK